MIVGSLISWIKKTEGRNATLVVHPEQRRFWTKIPGKSERSNVKSIPVHHKKTMKMKMKMILVRMDTGSLNPKINAKNVKIRTAFLVLLVLVFVKIAL